MSGQPGNDIVAGSPALAELGADAVEGDRPAAPVPDQLLQLLGAPGGAEEEGAVRVNVDTEGAEADAQA